MGQVEKSGISFQTAVNAKGEIESQEGFENFVNASINYVTRGKGERYINEIGSYSSNNNAGKRMSIATGKYIADAATGIGTYQSYEAGSMQYELGGSPDVRNSINFFRSSLAHELRHVDQEIDIRGSGTLSFPNRASYRSFEACLEIDAYNHQMKHWTWDALNARQQSRVKASLDQYKR